MDTYEYVIITGVSEYRIEAVPHVLIPSQDPYAEKPRRIAIPRGPNKYAKSSFIVYLKDKMHIKLMKHK